MGFAGRVYRRKQMGKSPTCTATSIATDVGKPVQDGSKIHTQILENKVLRCTIYTLRDKIGVLSFSI